MRRAIIIERNMAGKGYVVTIAGICNQAKAGINPDDAARTAVRLMTTHGHHPEGTAILAPEEVMEHIPEDMRQRDGQPHA